MSSSSVATPDPVEALADADETYRDLEARIEDHGEASVEAVADAYDRATGLLRRYEEQATGTGRSNFQKFMEFKAKFGSFVEGLDEELPAYDAFDAAGDRFDKNRLNERDFERAREDLEPAADIAGLLEDREDARSRYRRARNAAEAALAEARGEVADRERLVELGEADLSAPVDEIREPIEAYNEAVREAFAAFRREASAREVLGLVEATREFPLVAFREPPESLRAYVEDNPAGDKPVPELVEFARYSNSKLDHYVDDPAALKRAVATNETYLDRLDAGPLELAWPPRPAADLRWRLDELVSVVGRFAPDEAVAKLRAVQNVVRDEDRFERLRTAAVADEQLSDAERRKVESGAVEDELERLRARVAALEDALDEYPER